MASKRRLQYEPLPAKITLVGMLPHGRGPNGSQATIDELVAEMKRRKLIAVKGNNVSYHIPH